MRNEETVGEGEKERGKWKGSSDYKTMLFLREWIIYGLRPRLGLGVTFMDIDLVAYQ